MKMYVGGKTKKGDLKRRYYVQTSNNAARPTPATRTKFRDREMESAEESVTFESSLSTPDLSLIQQTVPFFGPPAPLQAELKSLSFPD